MEDHSKLQTEIASNENVMRWFHYGSRFVLGDDARDGADYDIMVLCRPETCAEVAELAESIGYTTGSEEDTVYPHHDNRLVSYRKGLVNLVLCEDPELWALCRRAAHLCKELRLDDKTQRVLVHDVIEKQLDYFDALEAWI